MIAVSYETVNRSIDIHQAQIDRFTKNFQSKLLKLCNDGRIKGPKKDYLNYLYSISSNLITAKPSSLAKYRLNFDSIIPAQDMKSSSYKNFRKKVLTLLDYVSRRSDFYPYHFSEVGIKACVYCNAMLAVTVEIEKNQKKRRKAKFQVDHYLPKSEYPCFSISLYNLYPTCANCNNSKSANSIYFKLYEPERKVKQTGFIFELDLVSAAVYMLLRDRDLIEFTFKEPSSFGRQSFRETFAIQEIYNTQKDLAEEIILKAESYVDSYKSFLKNLYPEIFTTSDITNRLLMGNYTDEKDMHKRPMAKFMSDISKQVGLI